MPVATREIDSPVGPLYLEAVAEGLTGVYFGRPAGRVASPVPLAESVAGFASAAALTILDVAAAQLDEYFVGRRRDFDLPLRAAGTAFQRAVWAALCTIPYGTTLSYGELAERIGRPSAVRAVGAANGRNPLSIVVPCHRVIGSDGSLTGFGGGLPVKQRLLELEGALPTAQRTLGL